MRFRLSKALIAAACLVLSNPAAAFQDKSREPTPLNATPLSIFADTELPAHGQAPRIGKLEPRGGFELTTPNVRFGGLSGLSAGPGPDDPVLAVSDRGTVFRFRLLWREGQLVGLADQANPGGGDGLRGSMEVLPILDCSDSDTCVGLHKRQRDAEVIAWAGGKYLFAFENRHRLWLLPLDEAQGNFAQPYDDPRIPLPAGFRTKPSNAGIEALAPLPDGRMFIAAEYRNDDETTPAWIVRFNPPLLTRRPPGDRAFRIASPGGFVPTDAFTVPPGGPWAGDVLVLERYFSWPFIVKSRIRRLRASQIAPGADLSPPLELQTLATIEQPLAAENYEGLAAIRDENGRLILLIVSDDNFSPLQRTLLFAFAVDED